MKFNFFILVFMLLCSHIFCQTNNIKYFAQYYNYELNDLNGIRQTLTFAYGLSKKLSIEFQVFTGSGRGKDISSNFKADFVLLSKANKANVPAFLYSINESYEGIHSYKRISDALKQDNGWGISLNYKFLERTKFNADISLGYLTYNTKAIVRDNIIDLKITLLNDSSIKDYKISYPTAIHINHDDGAAFARVNISYKIHNRFSLGMSTNLNYSLWNSGLDLGLGTTLNYNLSKKI